MNIENLQALIAQGLVTDLASIDPAQAYVAVGVYQKGNRQKGSANNTYPQYAIPVSELGGAGNVYTASNGIKLVGNDFQLASNLISQFTNDAGYLVPSAITGMVTGSGIQNYLTKWDASGTNLIDSALYESGGNVGIGTNSPYSKLHVKGSTSVGVLSTDYAFKADNSANSPLLYVRNDGYISTGTTVLDKKLTLYDNGSYAWGFGMDGNGSMTMFTPDISGANSALRFGLRNDGTNTFTEIMRVNQDNLGNKYVGIGTTSPTSRLHIKSENATPSNYAFKVDNSSTSDGSLFNVRNDGNVGIAISNPLVRLHVKGANSSNGVNDYTAKFDNSADAILLHLRNDGFVIINGLTIGKGANQISTNVVFGVNALANTTGTNNIAIGELALNANTTGANNTSVGHNTLKTNTTGYENIAIGTQSLNVNTTGYKNTAIGSLTLLANTTGFQNVAIGTQTMVANTTGSDNTAIGWFALRANVSGSRNTAIGRNALELVTGSFNVGVGYRAGANITTGEYNTAVGNDTMALVSTGSYNTFIGRDTGRNISTGSANTIVGASVTGLAAGTTQNVILADGYGNIRFHALSDGKVGLGTSSPTSKLQVVGLPTYADNTAATGAGLTAGAMYIRTGHGLDIVV